jgi:tetratricopeptide (TPR) repeat protein
VSRWLAPLLAASTLSAPAPAIASPESRQQVVRGHADLVAGRYEDALRSFRAASAADPTDADAALFEGVTLNRLARYPEALSRLERAKALGSVHPDLAFEVGWSLLGTPRWREAIAVLEAYERVRPGRGQTSEFLGRAHFQAGAYDRAEGLFREAMRRAPELGPTTLFYLALLEQARNNPAAAQGHLRALAESAPGDPLIADLKERLAAPAPREARPWRLAVSAGGGHNSNVIALGDRVRPPVNVSSKRSAFARFTLEAGYDWQPTEEDTVSATYSFLSDVYGSLSSYDLLNHSASLAYQRMFPRGVTASLRLSDEFAELGGKSFRNQWTLRPAVAARVTDWLVPEAAYTLAVSEYFFPTTPRFDRDGDSHTAALTAYFTVPGTALTGRAGYFRTWSDTDGADFDSKTHGFTIGLSHPLPWGVTGDFSYTRTSDRYDRANTYAGPAGFGFRRKDGVDSVGIELRRAFLDWLRAYARYDYNHADSNIGVFTYHQHIWSAGVGVEF